MWSIFRIRNDENSSETSILFNLIRFERDKVNNRKEFSINFIFPIVSNEVHNKERKFNILGGLLGLETGEKSKIRILYIPINI